MAVMTTATLSSSAKLNVASLVVAATGILMQYFSGVEGFPLIPPGPIVLLAAAALVAFGSWRWTPAVGMIAPLFVLIGGTIATIVNWGAAVLSAGEASPLSFLS